MFAGGRAWFSTNFSVRAVLGLDYYRGFVIWGFLAGAYFYAMMARLATTVRETWLRRSIFLLTLLACVSLGYSLLIPYLPKDIPRWASLHVALAAGACVLQMTALLLVLLRMRCISLLLAWGGIVVCSAALFITAGMVTTALEVFFTLSAALLLRSTWLHRLKQCL